MAWYRLLLGMAVMAVILATGDRVAAQTLAGGDSHAFVIDGSGSLWAVGLNGQGRLGDGTTTQRRERVPISGLGVVTGIAAGTAHSVALKADGTVYAWGNNTAGQVGDGTTTQRTSPVALTSLTNVTQLAAGPSGEFTLALKADGTVYAWGRNTYGQLGDGTTTNRTTPTQIAALSGIVGIAASTDHALAVKSDGTVWAWGRNTSRQLGDGTTTSRNTPAQVAGLSGASGVAAGATHSLARLTDGSVYAWGANGSGQLGDGTTTARSVPTVVPTAPGDIVQLLAGGDFTVARTSTGAVWLWGLNNSGQLGDGTTTQRNVPTLSGLPSISAIGVGGGFVTAVDATGAVWAWGTNAYGQLGDGTLTLRTVPVDTSLANYTWRVATVVPSVAAGTFTTPPSIALTSVTAGATIRYTLDGTAPTTSSPTYTTAIVPTVSTTVTARAFKAGAPDSLISTSLYTLKVATPTLSPSGGSYTTAQSVSMSTTTGGTTLRYTLDGTDPTDASPAYTSPLAVSLPTTVKAAAFKTGWDASTVRAGTFTFNYGTLPAPTASLTAATHIGTQSVALAGAAGSDLRYTLTGADPIATSMLYAAPFDVTTSGTLKVKAFKPGYTASATLSVVYAIKVPAPTLSQPAGTYAPGTTTIVTTGDPASTLRMTVSGGDPAATDAVVASGAALTVGRYTLKVRAYQTGCDPSDVTVATYGLTDDLTQPKLAAGQDHSVLVMPDGTVQAWGRNTNGQLAFGHTTTTPLPAVTPLTGVIAAAAGVSHTLLLTHNATVLASGGNGSGQLGDGTTVQRTAAVPVLGLTQVTAIAAGSTHSLALRADGTVWAWGLNTYGQLGDGSTTTRTSPVPIPTLVDVVAIAAGASHSLAVRSDGTVWSWGLNTNRQLADPSISSRTTPGQVPGLTTAQDVAAGGAFSVARLQDGTLVAWGANASGQLGDGTTTQRSAPVPVLAVTDATSLHAGESFAAARDGSGQVWTWGANGQGQLATGTLINQPTPAPIAGLSAVTRLGLGQEHALALSVDRVVYTWGGNANGELGDGSTLRRPAVGDISAAAFAWRVAMPVASVAPGAFTTPPSVALTSLTPGATVHYTTDGADPTDASPAYNTALVPTGSTTVKARANLAGRPASLVSVGTYVLRVVTPTASPSSGTYGSPQTVTLATTTAGATLRYTLDGSVPSSASAVYEAPLIVDQSLTLKVIAEKTGWETSAVATLSFAFNYGTLPTPTASLTPGVHVGSQTVTLAGEPAAQVRYTTNGAEPSVSSTLYAGPFALATSGTLKVKAFRNGYSPSPTLTVAYQIQVTTPTIAQPSGTYAPGTATAVAGDSTATLRYTLDGADPSTTDAGIASGASLTLGRFTLKVRAYKAGCEPSAIATATYGLTDDLTSYTVTAGVGYSVLVASDGTVWSWGTNTNGQLGMGTTTSRVLPGLTSATGIVSASAGGSHLLLLTSSGSVLAAGNNGSGRLGDGTTTQQPLPVPVSGLTNVAAVAAGGTHSLALRADGTVWAWGANGSGQLGDGTTTARSTPVQVSALSGITAIAAGASHSVAVKADGTVWTWGLNTSRQLADVTVSWRATPAAVVGVTTATAVAAGSVHTLARLQDGTVVAWGTNTAGQLGDGTLTLRLAATPVLTLETAVTVYAGDTYSAARLTDGTLVTWGANGSGQLGDGTSTARSVPDAVAGMPGVAAAAAGAVHGLAVTTGGAIWGWGGNTTGAIGDGTTASRPTAVPLAGADVTWLSPTPTLSVTAGTYAAPFVVTVGHARSDAVMRWTADGTTPDDSSSTVAVGGTLPVDASQTLRVRAWVADRAPSPVASAAYVLQVPVPTLTPASGTYTAVQTVTAAVPSGATVRYTIDGSTPTETSAAYAAPFVLPSGATVTARAFRAGWTPSAAVTRTIAYNLGTLPAPSAAPAPGPYTGPQTVTLSATTGATIHYSFDGVGVVTTWPVYTAPLVIEQTRTLYAQAWHPDYATSTALVGTYTLPDTTPPVITAQIGGDLVGDWYRSAVVLHFMCTDTESAVTACPADQVVTVSGAQSVLVEAFDAAGNRGTLSVPLSIDLEAPSVAITSPVNGAEGSLSVVTVTMAATDALSGVASVTCAGEPASDVGGGVYQCARGVQVGANLLQVDVVDTAGNVGGAAVRVRRTGPVMALRVAPSTVTAFVGEHYAPTVLSDDESDVSGQVTWTTSDPGVVAIDAAQPEAPLEATGIGTTTLTATLGALSTTLTMEVLAATTEPAIGTTAWVVSAPTGWSYLQWVPGGRDETGATVATIATDGSATRLQVIGQQGTERWALPVPEGAEIVQHDHSGVVLRSAEGVIAATDPRLAATWRYRTDHLPTVARGVDGTVYVAADGAISVLDGATGARRADHRLPSGSHVVWHEDCGTGMTPCQVGVNDTLVSALTVDEHGTAYFVGQHWSERTTFGEVWGEMAGQYSMNVSDSHEARAYTLTPAGALSSVVLSSSAVSWVANDSAGTPPPVFPTLGDAAYVPWPGGGAVLTWTDVDGYGRVAGSTSHSLVVGGATVSTPPPLSTNTDSVLFSDDGHVWVGTPSGATKLDGATGHTILSTPGGAPLQALAGGGYASVIDTESGYQLSTFDQAGALAGSLAVGPGARPVSRGIVLQPSEPSAAWSLSAVYASLEQRGLTNLIDKYFRNPTLLNWSGSSVLMKGENCSPAFVEVPPAVGTTPSKSYVPMDGLQPPGYLGDWLKVGPFVGTVHVRHDGTPLWLDPSQALDCVVNRSQSEIAVTPISDPHAYERCVGRKAMPEWSAQETICGNDLINGAPMNRCGFARTDWDPANAASCQPGENLFRKLYRKLKG
ncbi:RCC1 domain-containing protein [Luteitalea sp.]